MKSKKKLVIIIAAVAVIAAAAAIAAIALSSGKKNYTVNAPDTKTALPVPDVMELFSEENAGFSFLFPAALKTEMTADGAYIYCSEEKSGPYVLIYRGDKNMSPESYFKSCNKLMLGTFESVKSTPIQEAEVGGKTLYLTRYQCSNKSAEYVIDRYFEPYEDFYIQYTAVSDTAGSLDTPLYYAVSTLRVNEGAYDGAFSPSVTRHEHPDTGLKIDIPDMLKLRDLTIGYYASSRNAVMLAVVCTKDENGKPIYNRQDFIDRAAVSPDFVADQLGADSASFTEGSEKILGGKSFYCYPMDMTSGGESYTGELCIANADETGCWLICYAVRKDCPSFDRTGELFRNCIDGLEYDR